MDIIYFKIDLSQYVEIEINNKYKIKDKKFNLEDILYNFDKNKDLFNKELKDNILIFSNENMNIKIEKLN